MRYGVVFGAAAHLLSQPWAADAAVLRHCARLARSAAPDDRWPPGQRHDLARRAERRSCVEVCLSVWRRDVSGGLPSDAVGSALRQRSEQSVLRELSQWRAQFLG